MTTQYLCPICKTLLIENPKQFCCSQNHSYDRAKEGYVNLLPVQFKHSKNPGDNKAMVNARRRFLDKQYYQPLVNELISIYNEYGQSEGNLLDAGCGEGYYTHQHKTALNTIYGVDIAKEAVKKAAKSYQSCHFSVGTLSQLPFNDNFFAWIISIYAPILEQEFTRVLAENGYLLTVTPAANHLIELKQYIYKTALEHDVEREAIEQLKPVMQRNLHYTMTLRTGEDCLDLLSMTPFAFKASEEAKRALSNQENFNCQADFLIKLYKKTSSET